MNELYQQQLQKQQSALKKLDEKIKQLENSSKQDKLIKDRLDAKIFKKLYKHIDAYKKENFKEVVKKIIIENEQKFKRLILFNKKNIQNYLSTPLSLAMIEYIDEKSISDKTKNFFFEIGQISNKQIIDISKYAIELFQNSFKDIFSKLSQKNQYTSALLFFIKTKDISKILFINLLWLQQYENEKSDEFNQLSRQNRGDKIIDDIKSLLQDYDIETNFLDDKIEQQVAQELIDFLIELIL
jgi:hypothetical protein